MPRKKVTETTETQMPALVTKWPEATQFVINEEQTKKIKKWKQAHNEIFGFCDESEYEYIFVNDSDGSYSIKVRNTYHDTELGLTEDF